MGNQLNKARAMIAQVRIWMNVNVIWAMYGLMAHCLRDASIIRIANPLHANAKSAFWEPVHDH